MRTGRRDEELVRVVCALGEDLDLRSVLGRIVDGARTLASARYGALGVIGEDGHLVAFVHRGIDADAADLIGSLPTGHGILGAVVTDPRPLRLHDLGDDPRSVGFPAHHPPMHSFLGVPVRIGDVVFGNLYLTERLDGEAFDDDDERVVEALAAAAASAISNAQLYDVARRHEAQLRAVHSIANALLSGAGEALALELVALHARDLLHADGAVISLLRHDGAVLENRHVVGEVVSELRGARAALDATMSAHVIATGRSRRIDGVAAYPEPEDRLLGSAVLGPAVFVPLRVADANVGTIAVVRTKSSSPFSARDLEVLEGFATHAGVVIEHARAHAALSRLAAVEAEERLATALYEDIIQQVFSAGLSLSSAESMLAGTEAGHRVAGAVDQLDAVIASIRRRVFEARDSTGPPAPA